MAKKRIKSDVVADLTWAELYTAKMRENLKILIPAVKKISTRAELMESAALLRQQLASANRMGAELRKMIGVEPSSSNRGRSNPSIH